MVVSIVIAVLSIIIVITIVAYSTWLFGYRLRTGASKLKSLGEWLKHLLEALWGL
jgi:Tfp pilus assembly protein FimT